MTTAAVASGPKTPLGRAPSPPSTPSPAAIARRGRRPALIPPTVDLSSLFSSFSPSSSTYHATALLSNTSGTTTTGFKPPLFVLPPPVPSGHYAENETGFYRSEERPIWRNVLGDNEGSGWSSDEDAASNGIAGRGAMWGTNGIVGPGIKNGSLGPKAELTRKRRLLFLGNNHNHNQNNQDGDGDAMEVDDDERGEVERDVFSWVNSTTVDDDNSYTGLLFLRESSSHLNSNSNRNLAPTAPTLEPSPLPQPKASSYLQLPKASRRHRPKGLPTGAYEDEGLGSGTYTAPTSPLSGSFGEEIEAQRRRLEEAGIDMSSMGAVAAGSIGASRDFDGMEGVEKN